MNSNKSVCSAWPSTGPSCMNQKQPRDVMYFEMPLLSRHQVKELGQNLVTSRICHRKFLFLWWILMVILPVSHGAVTKSPRRTLPKEGESHWKSEFTALEIRESLSFWFPKGLVQGKYHHRNYDLLSPAQSMRCSHSDPPPCESVWTAFTSFRHP